MKKPSPTKSLPAKQRDELLRLLEERFSRNPGRHPGILWSTVKAKLEAQPDKLWSLHEMERTGGEPDVTGTEADSGAVLFMDCSAETPKGRISVCYDREGLESRKEHKPENTAADMAAAMGIEILSETEYHALQALGNFDTKTSSWLKTPDAIRKLGGALFGDRRYGRVFIYHNGAQSYYSVRGFRGVLQV